jgi:hypothetical protein
MLSRSRLSICDTNVQPSGIKTILLKRLEAYRKDGRRPYKLSPGAEPGELSFIANLDFRRTDPSALSRGSISSTAADYLPSCCERGSVAKFRSEHLLGFRTRADHRRQSVQGTSIPRRGDSAGSAVVLAISTRIRARRRATGGARPRSRCQLCLALGASLLARTELPLSVASQAHQPKLPSRRNLYKGEERGQVSVSGRGFNGADH